MGVLSRAIPRAALLCITLSACSTSGSFGPPALTVSSTTRENARTRTTNALTIIHAFQQNPDGQWPIGGITRDPTTGNIFGTTSFGGGADSEGTVFELKPSGSTYAESILYSFSNADNGLVFPTAAPTLNSQNELYVSVQEGGPYNYGGAVKLRPNGSGGYDAADEFLLHPGQGEEPADAMTRDGRAYYTTTLTAAEFNCGSILSFRPGNLKGEFVYAFKGTPDACFPLTRLSNDSSGALYGVSETGGSGGYGCLFKFQPSGSGVAESVAYSFPGGAGGQFPLGGVTIDKQGNVFGVTFIGGTAGFGTVYELKPKSGGYDEKILHNFGGPPDGAEPTAPLTLLGGKLFGTTGDGGTGRCVSSGRGCGTIFELDSNGSHYRIVYDFQGPDGEDPANGPLIAGRGVLFGATEAGGPNGLGEVYEFVP